MQIRFKNLNKKQLTKLWVMLDVIVLVYGLCLLVSVGGGNLNDFVVDNNNGKMPVSLKSFNTLSDFKISYMEDQDHFSYEKSSEVKYPLLTDIIAFHSAVYSIGDIMMYISEGIAVLCLLFNIYLVFKPIKIKWKR